MADKKKRKIFTRRRLLIGGGALVGAAAVGTGGFLIREANLRGRDASMSILDHRVVLPDSVPKMVVARGTDPALNVRAAVDRMGGMKRFIGPDDVVVVKPNVGWERVPAQAANTHPGVVAEVVRTVVEAKPKRVIVCDCPVNRSRPAFEKSGILEASLKAGAEVILPEESTYHTVHVSERLGTWDVLEPFVEATKLINVPVAKHHNLTGVTAGMKNWIGITGKLRMRFHGDLQKSIAELAALMKPTLTVMDASRVLMEAGPSGGNVNAVKNMGVVAVGTDPVAMDAFAFSLFDVGQSDLPEYFRLTAEMKLGTTDFMSLGVVELVT